MFKYVDRFLDRITMYRLVLYFLTCLFLLSLILAYFNLLQVSFFGLMYSLVVLVFASYVFNRLSAKFFGIPENIESVYITAYILCLILAPPDQGQYVSVLWVLVGAAAVAQVSKYALNFRGKHIFNPAALGVFLVAVVLGQSATWWVGSTPLFLPLLFGVFLILRKLKRFSLALAFLAVSFLTTWFISGAGTALIFEQMMFSSATLFFVGVMLTEPVTMPPTRKKQIVYGALTGLFFSPAVHLGSLYFTPEMALLVGNIFSFAVSPKFRYALKLEGVSNLAKGIKQFAFSGKRFKFLPGQYMEWTLPVTQPDTRGNRRYLTIASSPTEKETLIGVRFYENPSAYKKSLQALPVSSEIMAGQLAGDFVLPRDANLKLAFLAGGIGVTPFRSMVKFLTDTKQKRDVVMLYATGTEEEIAYKEIWEEAKEAFGFKFDYALSGPSSDWSGLKGYVNKENILSMVPDYKERIFYVSGSVRMVEGAREALKNLGVKDSHIKTDFFPGLA